MRRLSTCCSPVRPVLHGLVAAVAILAGCADILGDDFQIDEDAVDPNGTDTGTEDCPSDPPDIASGERSVCDQLGDCSACYSCADQCECAEELNACSSSESCNALLSCYSDTCGFDSTCTPSCDAAYPEGVALVSAWSSCWDITCYDTCGGGS